MRSICDWNVPNVTNGFIFSFILPFCLILTCGQIDIHFVVVSPLNLYIEICLFVQYFVALILIMSGFIALLTFLFVHGYVTNINNFCSFFKNHFSSFQKLIFLFFCCNLRMCGFVTVCVCASVSLCQKAFSSMTIESLLVV